MEKKVSEIANLIVNSGLTIALTGAGISVDSGIPDFRSKGGLWEKLDPMEYLSLSAFLNDPEKSWKVLFMIEDMVKDASPNPGHIALAELERLGFLHHIITQNIDNLHQLAGSKNVIELHGSAETYTCLKCGKKYSRESVVDDIRRKVIPVCPDCKFPLKPDVTFFEEPLPKGAISLAFELARKADVLLIIGTSAVVAPANHIPFITHQNGGTLFEFNLTATSISHLCKATVIGRAKDTLPALVEAVKRRIQ